jgi:hypothetical protein
MPTESHPWGQSHSENHQPVDPLQYLNQPLEHVTPEQMAEANQAFKTWQEKQGSTLGDLFGVLKTVFKLAV